MEYKIAIIITTFLRDTLLYKTLQSIVDNYTEDCIVLVGDQGYASDEKDIQIDYFQSQIPLEYYRLPFDCGLSAARNYLINVANEKNIPYTLMGADSIKFIYKYDFQSIINFLEKEEKIGLVGFNLIDSKCSWEFLMEVIPQGIKFALPYEHINENNIDFLKVDICRNIFLAKTKTVLNLYDEELKLGEHEMAFLEYKKRGYQAFWTNYLSFKRVQTNTSEEYQMYRKRLGDYLKIVKAKLNIKGWVIYPKENK